jgi:heme/copper-type cytochrome/quinol oxidase subunit 2
VTILLHVLLALTLTLFLIYQAHALAVILRARRVQGRAGRPADLVWTVIPVLVVLFLAARSWLVLLDANGPAVASLAASATSLRAPLPGSNP